LATCRAPQGVRTFAVPASPSERTEFLILDMAFIDALRTIYL
jgi:hypothetical protein